MSGLIVFIHGLMGNKNSWGAVPDLITKTPNSNFFKVVILEYSATLTSSADIEKSAGQLLTKIETLYGEFDPIYLVGHSLGGLIAREICRTLIEKDDRDTLDKIPAVITVGTPLAGAKGLNWLLRRVPLLSPKIGQIANSKLVFDHYRHSLRYATEHSLSRPKQIHIEIENDGIIASHNKDHFTDDDITGGVIPGTHRDFAGDNTAATYVADVLLRHILKVQNARSRPYRTKPEPIAASDLPDRLILIACSHNKVPGGEHPLNCIEPAGWMPEVSLRQDVIAKRSYVYGILTDGKLADGFEKGGNRAHQPANAGLKHGADFGGTNVVEDIYLPAWKRYSGRTYGPLSGEAWQSYFQSRGRVRILIMSGLYGLIEPEECTQNYDVHLSDTHTESGQSIASMWSDIFTKSISAYIQSATHGRKVKIFNLLCDQNYVSAIKWHELPTDCSVFHLSSPTLNDVNLLPPAGIVLNSFLKNLDQLEEISRDTKTYELSRFGEPPAGLSDAKLIFESRIGSSKSINGDA